jgi:hypothetical protein
MVAPVLFPDINEEPFQTHSEPNLPNNRTPPECELGTGLVHAVIERWQSSAYQPLRQLRATLQAGALILEGVVPTFYLKQLAQELAMQIVRDVSLIRVENRIDVQRQT